MALEIEIDPEVFNPAYLPLLEDQTPVQLIMGGGGSGKSVFAAQRRALDMVRGDRNFLCLRQVANTLRSSIYEETKKAIISFGDDFASLFHFSLEPLRIICKPTLKIAAFAGLDDVEKVKSITPPDGVFTDIEVEEATETASHSIDQLMLRMRGRAEVVKRLTLLFNPTDRNHWIAKKHFVGVPDGRGIFRPTGGSVVIRTTYLDNNFLEADDIARIEGFRISNPDFFKVYGRGEWGTLGKVIFKKWQVADLSKIRPAFEGKLHHGIDFGFAEDPFAFVSVGVRSDNIYIFSELVSTGLSNADIAREIKNRVGRDVVECDSAEPKSISELREYGINAVAAMKGADSVLFGIQWLQGKTIFVDISCKTCANELALYQWMQDNAGNAISKPVDKNNHAIDALRYALCRIMRNAGVVRGAKV